MLTNDSGMEEAEGRTHHARAAVHIKDLVAIKFENQTFGTTTRRLVEVSEPDGPSTDGGRKARQVILLRPESEDDVSKIVCGFIDTYKGTAEVRSYHAVNQHFQARYKESVDMSRGEYERFVDELLDFLKLQDIETHVTHAPPPRANAGPGRNQVPAHNKSQTLLVAVVVGVLVGLGLGFLLFGKAF